MTQQEIKKRLVTLEEAEVVSLCAELLMLLSYDNEVKESDNDFLAGWKNSRKSVLETIGLSAYNLQDLLEN